MFPSAPGTWSRELLLERCQLWAIETGAPPKYNDWMPVDRSRHHGASTAGAEKWEREAGLWPQASLVYRYFDGGWREMFLEAGFPSPPPILMPLQERIPYALTLYYGEGLEWAAVGEIVGMKPDSIRRYTRAHPCATCHNWVATKAPRCRKCANAHNSRWGTPWTAEECVAAIQLWVQRHGELPAADMWKPPYDPRWHEQADGQLAFPPAATVTKLFRDRGGWNGALNAAGYNRPRAPESSKDEIERNIRAFYLTHGEAPTRYSWDRTPSWSTVAAHYDGNPNDAMRAASVPIRTLERGKADALSDQQLYAQVRHMAEELGHSPRPNQRIARLKGEYCSPSYITKRLRVSWNEILIRSGLPITQAARLAPTAVLDALDAFHAEHGRWPKAGEWNRGPYRPALTSIYRKYDTFEAALDAAQKRRAK
jgi:hypothetical protein